MADDWRTEEALWRYGLIREAADERLTGAQRGALVRALAARLHAHPSGELKPIGRSTLDDWIRAYRGGGFGALIPKERASVPRTAAALLEEAAALRRENPARTAAQISRILKARHGGRGPSESTVGRHLARVGLTRQAAAGARRVFGRFEASAPNELWVADCLHGPVIGRHRAILFAILDDHSRLIVAARFEHAETTTRLEAVLRAALEARGVPERLYVDNGAPFASKQLARACAVLGIRLVHSAPGRPQGRGKIERFFRTLREQFLVELDGRENLDFAQLDRLLRAWLERVYHRRAHSQTGQPPLERYLKDGFKPRTATARELREAFLWAEQRTVTKTATVSLHGNTYEVDPALAGRRVELHFDPYGLDAVEVYHHGRPFGTAVAHTIGRHVHPQARTEATESAARTGIDYLDLITTEHERQLARQINYHQLATEHDGTDQHDPEENR
jgi:putative transposase